MLNRLTSVLSVLNIKDYNPEKVNVNDLYVSKAEDWQFLFQKPNSPVMEGINQFHIDIVILLIFIVVFVMCVFYYIFTTFTVTAKGLTMKSKSSINTPEFGGFIHHPILEIVWTIVPAVILVLIAEPSFALLYSIEEVADPKFTFKAIGHQWYWSYEIMSAKVFAETVLGDNAYTGISDTSFESYMLPSEDLDKAKNHHIRLLAVDNYVALPTQECLRVLVTSEDVIHSWAVPSLGIKVDACPGRLNQTIFQIERAGFYYGQCSELCGVNHGFMPIGILAWDLPKNMLPKNIAEALFLTSVRENA